MSEPRPASPSGPAVPVDRTYLIDVGPGPADAGARDTVGGWPILPPDEPWPTCHCGTGMIFFFQFDVPAGVPTFGGDHALVFQCPKHNDACFPPSNAQLPPRYWDEPPSPNVGPFWRILLHRSGAPVADPDPYLRPQGLTLREAAETHDDLGRGMEGFKVGGVPAWAQDPEHYRCACGADLAFLCQLPLDFGFAARPGREPQPDGFSRTEYGLFLGNEVYVAACPAHCHPAAAWPVNQN
jgi:hypothetical protein